MIAVVKDMLIYITVIAAVIVIPAQLGGYAKIFASVPAPKLLLGPATATTRGRNRAYATLALGSALALFLLSALHHRHLSSRSSRDVIRRNAAMLPAYSMRSG